MKLYMPTKVYNEKGCVRQHSDLCFKYKQKYVVLKGQEVFYINNKEGLPLSKYIKYYQRLKV